ncbi:MAG: hypothetical protein M1498_03395 [Candidatus Thermoplasmatota archaeon]|nr:hypothetical protein [Candidatus Thermoplasmatota archaeon]
MIQRVQSELPLDDISKEVIRKFQWPRGESSKFTSRPSVYRMAQEFQVHPKVIKSRINSLFEAGVIRDIKFFADSRFVPWNRYFILCKTSRCLPQEIYNHFKDLSFVERLIFGTIKLPNSTEADTEVTNEMEFLSISIIASNKADMKRKTSFIEKKLGHSLDILEITNDFQHKERLVTAGEHIILNAILYENPLTLNIAVMSQKLAIPTRTVRRKVEKMLEEGVIYQEVSLDTSMAQDTLLPSIIMVGDYGKWLPGIRESKPLQERLLLYKNWSRFSFFIFYAESFSKVDQIIAAAKEIDPASMLTYRNGSYNNPYIKYPLPGTGK